MKHPLLSQRYPYPLIALVAESGAGKTALSVYLVKELSLPRIISCTTRAKREDETDDAYIFFTMDEFRAAIEGGEFAEWAEPFKGTLYGRRWKELDALNKGPALADMTEHGVRSLRASGVRIVCIRIEARHQERLDRGTDRTQEDLDRSRIPIDVEAVVLNDHGIPDGFQRACTELARLVRSYIAP